MVNSLVIELPWPPSVNHYYRHVGAKALISREGRRFRESVQRGLSGRIRQPFSGHLAVVASFFPPDKRRRDLDNLCKALLDSLTHAGVWEDDSQIKALHLHMLSPCKPYGKTIIRVDERIEIEKRIIRTNIEPLPAGVKAQICALYMQGMSDWDIVSDYFDEEILFKFKAEIEENLKNAPALERKM